MRSRRYWLVGQWMVIALIGGIDWGECVLAAAPSTEAASSAQTRGKVAKDNGIPEAPESSSPLRLAPAPANSSDKNSSADPSNERNADVPSGEASSESGNPDRKILVDPPAENSSPASPADASQAPSLEPTPDPQFRGSLPIEPASFNGITPGQSTRQKLQSAWGNPKQVQKQGEIEVHLYSIEPFQRVEVALADEKVSSIIIWLEEPFPANQVAQQLDLARIQPVFVSNDLGEILGQGYPERGVIFGFEPSKEPGKTSQKVVQIILEPIGPELFLLRAETSLDAHPSRALEDLDQVLRLAPRHGRAHWLRARVLGTLGQTAKALEAGKEAVRLDPGNSHYRLTCAQLLSEMGRLEEARQEAQQAIQLSQRRPHVKAQALCLLGDLASGGPKPDWKQALDYYAEAINTAEPLGSSPHPAVRLAAKNA
ncbi:MAG TPA: tetratricopeptide repeat protein, partial [Thermoguttaceae bacterium]|nr:tetratricopeptide repeat protein [Thermoguttaceae bacterium]